MRSRTLKLLPGNDLRSCIEKVGVTSNSSGFVLGVVGNLSRAAFQCPGRSQPTVLEGNLEIITLNGTFSPEGVHLHLSLSDGDCQVWGGHLEPGTLVLKGADILLALIGEDQLENTNHINVSKSTPPRIEIAVLPGCPWCTRALRILRSLDIPHSINNIDNEESFNAIKQTTEMSTFPQVFVDGKLIGGYEALASLRQTGELESFR